MGNVSSRLDESEVLYLRDQDRFSIAGLSITTSRGRSLLNIAPNSFPAARYSARRELGDDTPIDFVQDPDSTLTGGAPSILLRLPSDDELTFTFTCILRQQHANAPHEELDGAPASSGLDTQIAGLTYIFASNAKEIDQLVTREFNADPNLHRNPNVQLVGDYATGGSASVQFQWSWRWRPPKSSEDLGGGWRNTCSFVEYDQRAHKLNTLASFSFWVQNTLRYPTSPQQRSPRMETISPRRLRVPSAQSIESRISAISDSDGPDYGTITPQPGSPPVGPIPEYGLGLVPSVGGTNGGQKFDIACVRMPGEDPSTTEDGPLFRATMKSLESKTGTMRSRMKRVLRSAEAAEGAQTACNDAVAAFMDALKDAASSNANAVRPALDHYFEKIAKEILLYERQNTVNLQKLIIEPISKLYNFDIKQAESKKRDFEEESKDYYAYVGKYLGQRTESLKEKKRVESDSKYQSKRRTFELKRFDYSSFMHDLHGGRKDQEVLSQLTKYANAQAKGYLQTAKKVEDMVPQLDALCQEVTQADKEFQLQRTEREEKRRALEKNPRASMIDPDMASQWSNSLNNASANGGSRQDTSEFGRFSSARNSMLGNSPPNMPYMTGQNLNFALNPNRMLGNDGPSIPMRQPSNRFKGIRDLEEKDASDMAAANSGHRKEGLLWSLSRPNTHIDPKGLTKAAWHKFWIVLDQGKLSEYVNWKDKLDLHMEPIDLRMASVREARSSERRFCFEVITPHFTRVYQAPSEEDVKSWIASINNALQSAFEAKSTTTSAPSAATQSHSHRKDIAAVLTGKSSSFSGHRAISSSAQAAAIKAVARHATTGDKPAYRREDSNDSQPSELLNRIREVDEGNRYCADCGSEGKVEWVSINLGIVLCIECSGIHRSLGTHISKVRSLTLDISVFTPDIIELLLLIGNRVSNMIWEAKLDRFLKPAPHSTREQRLHFITAKYTDRAYVERLSTINATHTIDESLLTSIKKNEIQSVLHALALRANPNALDRSRSTHAVFLALAAADPAQPASSFNHSRVTSTSTINPVSQGLTAPSSTIAPSPNSRPSTPQRKPFPVAELLLQNGAEIPTQPAPIPLSRAAQLYLDFKIDQRTGRHLGAVAPAGPGGDGVAALPSIVGANGSPNNRDGRRSGFVGGVKALGESVKR